MSDLRLVWTDLETFGLDPDNDPVIEIGFKVTDLDLNTIDEQDWVIWEPSYTNHLERLKAEVAGGNKTSKIVFDMHTKSVLWADAMQNGQPPDDVEKSVLEFLRKHEVKEDDPLCGSSVQFDRLMLLAQFTPVHDLFSYRNIDVSTIKELCRRYNPPVYANLQLAITPKKTHRVMDDLDDTVEEFQFYRDSFLWVNDDEQ